MTVEASASMDLTNLFKSCMKTIRTRNKAMGVTLPPSKIFPTSSPSSQFYTRAKDVQSNIASHRNLLRDHHKKYLQDHEQSMTDHERNYMEKVVTTNLRIIDDNIRTLTLEVESYQQGSKDSCECRQNILSILRVNFQLVQAHFRELKDKRRKRQKEKDSLFKLQRPAGLKKREKLTAEDFQRASGLGQIGRKSFSQDTCDSSHPGSWSQSSTDSQTATQQSSDEHEVNYNKNEISSKATLEKSAISSEEQLPSSPIEDEMESMLGELSSEERQMLEEENLHLYKDLMSNQEEVRQITRQVVELGQMQDFFSEKVDIQAHQIEKIQETIMASTENVKEGNEQVREAMRKDAGFRVWIMFFLIVMSCTILFLDWYNG